jgi:hypothetical protein
VLCRFENPPFHFGRVFQFEKKQTQTVATGKPFPHLLLATYHSLFSLLASILALPAHEQEKNTINSGSKYPGPLYKLFTYCPVHTPVGDEYHKSRQSRSLMTALCVRTFICG